MYDCPVWSPHLAKDIHEIEKVQRRAWRITLHQRRQEMAYEERCKILKWHSLGNTKSKSNHPYKLQTKLTTLNCYENSFFVRIMKPWNDLPINVLNFRDSPDIAKFKLRSKNHMNIYWTAIINLFTIFICFLSDFFIFLFTSFYWHLKWFYIFSLGDPWYRASLRVSFFLITTHLYVIFEIKYCIQCQTYKKS